MNYILRKFHDTKFIKFILVGIINTIFGYSIFAILIFMNCNHYFALFASTVLGVLFNFKTTSKLVFASKDNQLLFRFICVYAVLYAFNTLILKITALVLINIYISGVIILILSAPLGFILNKEFVFVGRK